MITRTKRSKRIAFSSLKDLLVKVDKNKRCVSLVVVNGVMPMYEQDILDGLIKRIRIQVKPAMGWELQGEMEVSFNKSLAMANIHGAVGMRNWKNYTKHKRKKE